MRRMLLLHRRAFGWLFALLLFKMFYFDFIWCLNTTFTSFSYPQTYLTKVLLATLFALPVLWKPNRWYVLLISVIFDGFIISNMLYSRTYFTVIPLHSYALASNLADFTDSVWYSFRWSDVIYPLSTLFVVCFWKRIASVTTSMTSRSRNVLISSLLGVPLIIMTGIITYFGGYTNTYARILLNRQTCGAPMYSIPGVLLYQAMVNKVKFTPKVKDEVMAWVDRHNKEIATPLPYKIEQRDNCIIILCESLESFPIEKSIDGQEITPYLNKYIKGEKVLYAPYVLTQAKGARSIDAQLLLHTGLLPLHFGAYSALYPHNTYYSLDKAFKEKYSDAVTASFTVDKRIVWNAAVVAKDFGYDYLLDKPYFVLDEKTGPRNRLGDVSFLRQSYEKLSTEELFKMQGHTLVQLVTYSGHTPFIIPKESERIDIKTKMPDVLRRFLTVANYTDYAIGQFIEKIRSNPKFDNTMIVITGDHEGLADNRKPLLDDAVGKTIVGEGKYTPFIVLNSPVTLRYEKVMGQIDMYPTLLDLLNLNHYAWRGLGESILHPNKPPFAISPQFKVIGDTTNVTEEEIKEAIEAWNVSDLIIKTNFFKHVPLPSFQ